MKKLFGLLTLVTIFSVNSLAAHPTGAVKANTKARVEENVSEKSKEIKNNVEEKTTASQQDKSTVEATVQEDKSSAKENKMRSAEEKVNTVKEKTNNFKADATGKEKGAVEVLKIKKRGPNVPVKTAHPQDAIKLDAKQREANRVVRKVEDKE